MKLPIFKTTFEILEFCRINHLIILKHSCIPLAIITLLQICINILNSGNSISNITLILLSVCSTIAFLPLTATWYQGLVLGIENIYNKKIFNIGKVEFKILLCQIIIIGLTMLFLLLGSSIIFLIENLFPNITQPTKQVINIIIFSITILFCISFFCRLSLIIPMAASNRKIDLREALLQSKEIGIKMAAIWLICLMIVIALSIPIQIIFLLISKGLNFLSFGIIDSSYIFQNLFIPVMNSTISLLLLLFPATMVGFIYNNISSIVKDGDYDE